MLMSTTIQYIEIYSEFYTLFSVENKSQINSLYPSMMIFWGKTSKGFLQVTT